MCYHVECIRTNFLSSSFFQIFDQIIFGFFPKKTTNPIYTRKKNLIFPSLKHEKKFVEHNIEIHKR
jgi:hypothetical protein